MSAIEVCVILPQDPLHGVHRPAKGGNRDEDYTATTSEEEQKYSEEKHV